MSVDLHGAAAARLEDVEQRYTPSRHELVGILAAAGRPLTIPEILAAGRRLPQSSAYRNLGVLEQAGVVRRVHGADDVTRYELAEDLTEHHHHLVCAACGAVVDFTMPAGLERTLERAGARVALASGYEVQAHRLDFVGLCPPCREAGGR